MYETAVYEELWVGKNKKHKRSKKFCSFYFATLQRLLRLRQLKFSWIRKGVLIMKSNMIKLGTVCLSGAISRNEAAVVAVGDDIIVADVLRSGKLRYRQILEGVKPEEIDYDAKVVVVPKAVRRKLHHLFDGEPLQRGNAPHFAEYSEHRVSAPGDFKPLVKKGDILVADYGMSGTHYFRLSLEDRAWLLHRDGIEI